MPKKQIRKNQQTAFHVFQETFKHFPIQIQMCYVVQQTSKSFPNTLEHRTCTSHIQIQVKQTRDKKLSASSKKKQETHGNPLNEHSTIDALIIAN